MRAARGRSVCVPNEIGGSRGIRYWHGAPSFVVLDVLSPLGEAAALVQCLAQEPWVGAYSRILQMVCESLDSEFESRNESARLLFELVIQLDISGLLSKAE